VALVLVHIREKKKESEVLGWFVSSFGFGMNGIGIGIRIGIRNGCE